MDNGCLVVLILFALFNCFFSFVFFKSEVEFAFSFKYAVTGVPDLLLLFPLEFLVLVLKLPME
jgi:hypothetical protein